MNRSSASWVAAGAVVALVAIAGVLNMGRRAPREDAHEAPPPTSESAAPAVSAEPVASRAAPVPAAVPEAGTPAPAVWASEDSLMQHLRAIEDGDAAAALELAREGDDRFPSGDGAAERAMIEVKSLAREGHVREARGAAEQMVNRYPGTSWALEVERHTGAHPHVNH